jgi:hypothetical protein
VEQEVLVVEEMVEQQIYLKLQQMVAQILAAGVVQVDIMEAVQEPFSLALLVGQAL